MSSNRPATRFSARQAAKHAQSSSRAAGPPADLDSPAAPAPRTRKVEKRKAPDGSEDSPTEQSTSGRPSKRARVPEQPSPQQAPTPRCKPQPSGRTVLTVHSKKSNKVTTMSSPEYELARPSLLAFPELTTFRSAAGPSKPPVHNAASGSSSRKSSRTKKNAPGELLLPWHHVVDTANTHVLYSCRQLFFTTTSEEVQQRRRRHADDWHG